MNSGAPPLAAVLGPVDDCWNRIGIVGDRSCPALPTHIHCRNCPVYSAAAAVLLDRELPQDYVSERSQSFSEKKQEQTRATQAVLIFRIASEWLALPASCGVEVAASRPIHSLPGQDGGVVLGLLNVRGELLVCVSLHRLLGLPLAEPTQVKPSPTACPRLLVVQGEGGRLVIPVDEMHGLYRFHPSQLSEVPMTAAGADVNYAKAMLPWQGRMVGCLDDQLLIYALNRSLA
jgi:chemotaxis-related protein WspD